MVCEAYCAPLGAPDRFARCPGVLRKRWARLGARLEWRAPAPPRTGCSLISRRSSLAAGRADPHRPAPAALPGPYGETVERDSCLGQDEPRSGNVVWVPEEGVQSSPQREPGAALAPVTLTGSLVGRVVDPYGCLGEARLLVRDSTDAVVRECFPTAPYPRFARVPFEVHGLPAGTYTLEVRGPGFRQAVCRGARVEPSCITNVGTMRVRRAKGPRIPARLRRGGNHPAFLHPPPPPAGWRGRRNIDPISAR